MADTLAFRIYFEAMDDVGHIAGETHRSVETRFPSALSILPLSKSSLKRRYIELKREGRERECRKEFRANERARRVKEKEERCPERRHAMDPDTKIPLKL